MFVVSFPAIMTGRGHAAAVRRAVRGALMEIGRLAVSLIRRMILETVDERGFKGRHDRGILVNAVTAKAPVFGPGRAHMDVILQGPAARYGPVIEDGRKAGARMPPVVAIESWLRRDDAGKALVTRALAQVPENVEIDPDVFIRRLAFVVARSIGRKGFPGIHMFRRTGDHFGAGTAARILEKHLVRQTRAGG